jgi:hypothetical protein
MDANVTIDLAAMRVRAPRLAAGEGLPRLATGGAAAVDVADVLGAYDTGSELPVLFVDEVGGEETLTLFLYGV